MADTKPYVLKNKIRIVTATSLFDGHDVSINIMRRILQSSGAEVIHLGHDRSVEDVVKTAIQEDVNAIAMTSYQGGHIEYFKYMYDLLQELGGKKIKIFIQVNIGDENQKSGINKNQLSDFYQFCKTLKLNVVGLMCIPPFDQDSKKYFEEMGALNKSLNLNDLSMGMSSDYLEAINYSATYLRIGSSIFGNRN